MSILSPPTSSSALTPTTPSSAKRKKAFFTHADIEAQLQNLYLYSELSSSRSSTDSENLDHLGPIIRNIHLSKQQDAFLKHLNKFIQQKESEIEAVCRGHYQDFLGSVDKLLSVRQGTVALRSHVVTLDSSLQSSGAGLASARASLLDARKVASNIDDTIETLQACLRVLDLSKKVSQQISDGKFYSALRALDELQFVHLKPLLGLAAFAGYLGEALPNEKSRVREEATKQLNSWLFDAREQSGDVGRLAIEATELRTRRWKTRRDRLNHHDPASLAIFVNLNTPVEMAVSERHDYSVLDNHEESLIDFGPLYLAIHIHETLDATEELQRSFRDDRRAQAHLIISSFPGSAFALDALGRLLDRITGFFIIEAHLLRTAKGFRDEDDVDGLWEEMSERVLRIVGNRFRDCRDLEELMGIKTRLLMFTQTLEAYGYTGTQLNGLLVSLVSQYSELLHDKFAADFEQIVLDDDHQPMVVDNEDEFSKVAEVSFLPETGIWSREELAAQGFPTALPFSQTYPLCCIDIRNYVTQYHTFSDGVGKAGRGVDDVLRKSLDSLMIKHISRHVHRRMQHTRNLSQLAQIVVNTMFFQTACRALGRLLADLVGTGQEPKLESGAAFEETLHFGEETLLNHINAKTDDFFEMAGYDWQQLSVVERGSGRGSEYLSECVDYLETVMGSVLVLLPGEVQRRIYVGAWTYIGERLMSFLVDREPTAISDGGLSVLANDVRFGTEQASKLGLKKLDELFQELIQTVQLLQSADVGLYLDPQYREMKFKLVQPRKLAIMLKKLMNFIVNNGSKNVDPTRKESIEEVLKAVSKA